MIYVPLHAYTKAYALPAITMLSVSLNLPPDFNEGLRDGVSGCSCVLPNQFRCRQRVQRRRSPEEYKVCKLAI